MHHKTALGLCIGASTIKVVELKKTSTSASLKLGRQKIVSHECNTRCGALRLFHEFNPLDYDYVCLTGRKFKDLTNLPQITEPEATEYAFRFVRSDYPYPLNGILSLGSENFVLYCLNQGGEIVSVNTGNKCASGTGEFFLQQIRRMNLTPSEASFAAHGAEPYAVSGRCSVFCKSDCTHALNKGIPRARVCAGLANMIAEKALEILGTTPRENIMAVGGVTKNKYVMEQIRRKISNLIIPEIAGIFEALGAAYYAMEHQLSFQGPVEFIPHGSSFSTLPPLKKAQHLVTFQKHERGQPQCGDTCVLGLDVGSTTTKAVLLNIADNKILAAVYLRTNGDPIGASRRCYQEVLNQLGPITVEIVGLGVTGSGRYIAGLHAGTDAIINEIIAHATAAAFFDKDVDTIFEIGGQDAKYTYLVNAVPCDYAMNEACSAGTGSFLEEAAHESLNIDCTQIQDIALEAEHPPNFNEQCAAFISSDIKVASHENIPRQDIVAGLVYSICMNYNNRVKGARRVGQKVFMQGGVCYNRAVPLAMAALLNKEIIVPPEPGLMGAFGVALEVKKRIDLGLLKRTSFNLNVIAKTQVEYGRSFNCPGSKEKCDLGCQINIIKFHNKTFPFGGVCNKYYNLTHHINIDGQPFDLVSKRQELLCSFGSRGEGSNGKSMGLSRSFLFHLLYPFYSNFFSSAGFKIVLPERVEAEGLKQVNSAFCFPAEIAHGLFLNLAEKNPDYIFLPQVSELPLETQSNSGRALPPGHQSTCIIVQGEPYYLESAFRNYQGKILAPVLNLADGWHNAEKTLVHLASELGCDEKTCKAAFQAALTKQREFLQAKKKLGRQVLQELSKNPECIAIVLFGRPYNAFASEANMGIPKKIASRGIYVVPFDCLPYEEIPLNEDITWAIAQDILRAAKFVKAREQLFGMFITNFSCGPDAFLAGYFRDIMRTKPSLTLEIDSHTADAGVTTRVEAFLDIVDRYRKLGILDRPAKPFNKAQLVVHNGIAHFRASDGSKCKLTDPCLKLLFPSMGNIASRLISATFRSFGIRAEAVPIPDFKTLMLGRSNTSCKECLPLILVTGSLLEHVAQRAKAGQRILYFMPTTNGGCRFSQYSVFLNSLIEKKELEDVALMTLTSENSYTGVGIRKALHILRSIIISDALDDIKNALYALAQNRTEALKLFEGELLRIETCLSSGCDNIHSVLKSSAERLRTIPLKSTLAESKRVLMAGEIYVRRDEFSSQAVIERLAKRQIVVQRAPVLEWLHYIDYWVQYIEPKKMSWRQTIEFKTRLMLQHRMEKKIKRALALSGLYPYEVIDIAKVLEFGSRFMNLAFGGETILVVGRFFKDILKDFHGLVSIGPFACLPTRLAEAITKPESRVAGNQRLMALDNYEQLAKFINLPFLSLESDGNPFPQIIEAKIEAFALQVERVFQKLHGIQPFALPEGSETEAVQEAYRSAG